MLKKLCVLLFIAGVGAGSTVESTGYLYQGKAESFSNNGCVNCHSRIASLEMSARYLDWRLSPHRTNGVGCEKCHGGDSTARDKDAAHKGMLPASNPASRISETSVPETCGPCHKAIFNSFVESTHYAKLKESGLGPSCITCHKHMGASIISTAPAVESFCTFCHNSIDGLLPRNPELPRRAGRTLESIKRADNMVTWIEDLLGDARERKLDTTKEQEELRLLRLTLNEAKTGWHAFTLEGSLNKANKAFEEAVTVKDRLTGRLGNR